ncbi:heparinase II/III domain-containing protein [Caldivirga maquilingensis]|uniref:Heparinase II/III family protein n=1 Tax=Caldivirga maquilingensis (strain ATCC 700844 / DSM 13496 / JCM 10307 / IC-167) TaxID=397948 RepID=A8MBH5_CALMQ|nr:heparinase II/III family protein [Caldivirga maquilingensis]ABW02708.1 Heparinase II/III family protein [Caldivirga maquilingensis IC-167]
MITLENNNIRLIIHEASGTVVELLDKRSNAQHLLARKPELELMEPGMGILEIEPFIKSRRSIVNLSDDSVTLRVEEEGRVLIKEVKLMRQGALITIKATGVSRVRELIHVACGNGGYWGEALGAMYNCRYFVKFGFTEPPNSFSSVGLKPPVSGFRFSKHSYSDRYFPELKWIAFINEGRLTGLLVKCLSPCYGIVEDQFFNTELNLVANGEGEVSLKYELTLFNGLSRVDYVDDELIIGINSPSVVKPGDTINGSLSVYSLTGSGGFSINGYVKLVKSMPTLGRRGYDVDRVRVGESRLGLTLEHDTINLKPGEVSTVGFTTEPMRWSMEDTLYEVPYLEFNINGKVASRAFSINPDYAAALNALGRRNPGLVNHVGDWSDEVEGFYDDKSASIPIYELAAEDFSTSRRLIKVRQLPEWAVRVLKEYLSGDVKVYPAIFLDLSKATRDGYVTSALADMILKSASSHVFLGSPINDALKGLEMVASAYERGELIHWFNGIHGGAGSAGMLQLILAYDLIEDELPEELKTRLKLMFRWAQGELIKLTNAWAGNWELTEALALLAISSKFNFNNSKLGLIKAESVLRSTLNYFLNDGGWLEESAGYHNAVLNMVTWGAELLRLNGIDLYSITSNGEPVIKKAAYWLWNVLDPRYRTPALEDSGDDIPNPDPFIVGGVRYNDPVLLKVGLRLMELGSRPTSLFSALALADGHDLIKSPIEPRHEQVTVLDDSGRFIVRSSDEPNATYFILDYGPHGAWHGHPDKLSFELHSNGEPLIVDAGSGGYYSDLHWKWSRRSIAHNTVTLEDKDQLETRGRLVRYWVNGNDVYAVFEANTYPGVNHKRGVVALGKLIYVVLDKINGVGKFRWSIHCMGDVVYMRKNSIALTTGSTDYVIALPKTPEVTYGWRGHSIRTVYMYYEDYSDGELTMWGIIIPFKAEVSFNGSEVVISNGGLNYIVRPLELYNSLFNNLY